MGHIHPQELSHIHALLEIIELVSTYIVSFASDMEICADLFGSCVSQAQEASSYFHERGLPAILSRSTAFQQGTSAHFPSQSAFYSSKPST